MRAAWYTVSRAHVEFCMTDNNMLNVSAEGPRKFWTFVLLGFAFYLTFDTPFLLGVWYPELFVSRVHVRAHATLYVKPHACAHVSCAKIIFGSPYKINSSTSEFVECGIALDLWGGNTVFLTSNYSFFLIFKSPRFVRKVYSVDITIWF